MIKKTILYIFSLLITSVVYGQISSEQKVLSYGALDSCLWQLGDKIAKEVKNKHISYFMHLYEEVGEGTSYSFIYWKEKGIAHNTMLIRTWIDGKRETKRSDSLLLNAFSIDSLYEITGQVSRAKEDTTVFLPHESFYSVELLHNKKYRRVTFSDSQLIQFDNKYIEYLNRLILFLQRKANEMH